jgi:glycerol uptake facilitator-like aquaporin
MEVSMANNKPKKTTNKKSSKSKAATVKTEKANEAESIKTEVKTVEPEVKATVKTKAESSKKACKNPFKGFFAKKCDSSENILTVFKSTKIWGAVLGEVIGTMLLSVLLLTLGLYQPLYVMFGVLAITMAVYAFSGAHLNPIVTAGMMATRRVSAIRGVLYIVSQIIGAWLGLMLVNAFKLAGDSAAELPVMTELTDENIWHAIFIELVGAIMIGFFFTRAQAYKTTRGAFTYAAIVAGGVMMAVLFGIVISGNFFSLQNNFAMNPAIAIMYQIFPTSAENFGALAGSIALSGAAYILVPMVGGVIGSFLSDASSKLAEESIEA